MSTGHGAVRTTRSATLPITTCAIGPWPCVPITIRSALLVLAAVTMQRAGLPNRISVEVLMPWMPAAMSASWRSASSPRRWLKSEYAIAYASIEAVAMEGTSQTFTR